MANAKIQYTIRIEDLPFESMRHLNRTMDRLQQIIDLLKNIDISNTMEAAKKVDTARIDMGLVDLNLEDCYNMLSGYADYQAAQLQKTKQTQQEQAPDESTRGN